MAAPALHLAGMLAAMESGVGVRASQIDAWRQYADAVQAVLPPPPPPPPGPASGAAFARSAAIAADLVDKAKKAEALLAAIENLRKTLTPEQLERAKLLEPHFPPHGGPLMPPPPPPLPR